jgi:EAL domain-containing protein (putative c-di-GMP-specific phosphodiesterase class I)
MAESAYCKGVVLWSDMPSVVEKLRAMQGDADEWTGTRLVGRSWLCDLETLLESLTQAERQSLKATALTSDDEFNPWVSLPADVFAVRVATPWLPEVLTNGSLIPYFQPIVDIASERVVAFESLIRAKVGANVIAADRIIAAARCHGLMREFDELAREVCIREGALQLEPGESLFVNFAPAAIVDPREAVSAAKRAINATGIDLSRIVFEVVESEQFPEMSHLRHILDSFRTEGARVALDDLGAGKTALTFIQELEPDIVKLDRCLLPAGVDDRNVGLIAGITDYAHLHGVTVVAEGIETEAQFNLVRSLGIDLGQGWLFGKPAAHAERPDDRNLRRAA